MSPVCSLSSSVTLVLVLAEDDSGQTGDITALYAAANDLPTDDPLRGAPVQPVAASQSAATGKQQGSNHTQPVNAAASAGAAANARANPASAPPRTAATVIVADGKTQRVPSLTGLPVRKVIEQAAAAGLEVQITGRGTVREQAPVAGTMVAQGTKIVVRCGR